jgi:hydroxymethylpyrimidine pyrophosphatase-like HAD family hydrolase
MIIASDLDRTLMYSTRALEELGRPEETIFKPVEQKDGNWVGFMTETGFSTLQQINRQSLFVPVTTRTTEQFKRFVIFEKEIPLTYAITANGANILYQGEALTDWSEELDSKLISEAAGQNELLAVIKKEGVQFDGQLKQVEKLFFYFILNCLPTASELLAIRELVSFYGWRISLQGRKIYFIPTLISKGKALEYICNREGMEAIAGAGDSVLDWDFLQNCRNRFVPRHGELVDKLETSDVTLTNNLGIAAGEEILQHFQKVLSLKV